MRNDLTNSEVENKKLINTIAMMEKNTSQIPLIQMKKDKIKQKNIKK